ncbi:MAG: GGDEF domain-containing protein [Pseudomonadota bacterium]
MIAEDYFQLLNPLVFILFAIGFFCIDSFRPSRVALIFGFSYVFGALAFVADIVNEAFPPFIGAVPTAMLYAITAALGSTGLSLRYSGRTQWLILLCVAIAHIGIYAYLNFGVANLWWRSISANFGAGAIFAVGVWAAFGKARTPLDKAIYWLFAFNCLQCFLRPLILVDMTGAGLAPAAYNEQLFVMTLHLTVGVCAFLFGAALLIASSLEIADDLQKASITDSLSGLRNRRGFDSIASEGPNSDGAYSLILIDIDNFKRINDTYGHGFGDNVIAEMGALLDEYAVGDRVAGRIGGEEFAMLLPDEPLHDARDLADALRHDVERIVLRGASACASFTASFGVAQRLSGETYISTLSRADKALYVSKASGRNRVSCETDLSVETLRRATTPRERRRNRSADIIARLA